MIASPITKPIHRARAIAVPQQNETRPAPALTPHSVPLAPSDWWEDKESVVWDTAPRSPFAEAVHYLGLPTKLMRDGNVEVELTLDDLMLVIAYTRRYSGDKLPPKPLAARNTPVLKPYKFGSPAPTWEDEIPPLPEMDI